LMVRSAINQNQLGHFVGWDGGRGKPKDEKENQNTGSYTNFNHGVKGKSDFNKVERGKKKNADAPLKMGKYHKSYD